MREKNRHPWWWIVVVFGCHLLSLTAKVRWVMSKHKRTTIPMENYFTYRTEEVFSSTFGLWSRQKLTFFSCEGSNYVNCNMRVLFRLIYWYLCSDLRWFFLLDFIDSYVWKIKLWWVTVIVNEIFSNYSSIEKIYINRKSIKLLLKIIKKFFIQKPKITINQFNKHEKSCKSTGDTIAPLSMRHIFPQYISDSLSDRRAYLFTDSWYLEEQWWASCAAILKPNNIRKQWPTRKHASSIIVATVCINDDFLHFEESTVLSKIIRVMKDCKVARGAVVIAGVSNYFLDFFHYECIHI